MRRVDLPEFLVDLGSVEKAEGETEHEGDLANVWIHSNKYSLRVAAVAEDDTIAVSVYERCIVQPQRAVELSALQRLAGSVITDMWTLTNHRGFTDGVQLEFKTTNGEWSSIQIMTVGSRLLLSVLEEIS